MVARADARAALASVLGLARYPGVRVKLSGFYALTEPGHDYPHRAAWPYVEEVLRAFGTGRLLWGSDFSPSLEYVSFAQTIGLFECMPFLTAQDRALIEGGNLAALLDEVITPRSAAWRRRGQRGAGEPGPCVELRLQ